MKYLRKYIGDKRFYRDLLLVALPIALQQFFSALVNLIDNVMISNWGGTDASKALAFANRYFISTHKVLIMFAITAGVFIAQYNGSKDINRLKKTFGFTIISCTALGLIACLCGFFFNREIVSLFINKNNESSPQVLSMGAKYLKIISWTILIQAFTVALTFTFRPLKMTFVPLFSAIAATLINVIFNYLFIFVLNWGIEGAAIATLVARIIEMSILIIYYFYKKPLFYDNFRNILSVGKRQFLLVFKKSLPLMFSQILTEAIAILMLFYYAQSESNGSGGIAAIQTSTYIFEMVLIFVGGMGTAATVFVSTKLGDNKIDEARQNARQLVSFAGVFSFFSIIAMLLMIPFIPNIYGALTPSEIALFRVIIFIQAITIPFSILADNYIFIIRCGGKTMIAFLVNNTVGIARAIIIGLLIYLIPHLVMADNLDQFYRVFNQTKGIIVFIFILEKSLEIFRFIIGFYFYKRKKWLNNLTVIH